MNLAGFNDVDLKSEESRREFLDLNAITHETVFQALLGQGTVTPHYPIFTMAEVPDDWLKVHYEEHIAWSIALGLDSPPDLQDVDLKDPQQAEDWMNNHALHHNLVAITLGL